MRGKGEGKNGEVEKGALRTPKVASFLSQKRKRTCDEEISVIVFPEILM